MTTTPLKKTLYSHATDHVNVEIIARIEPNGDLVIDGFESGRDIEEALGSDADFEYVITIFSNDKGKLGLLLDEDFVNRGVRTDEKLLTLIRGEFGGSDVFNDIRNFLKSNDIPHNIQFWD